MSSPSFEDVMRFNKNILPLFRIYFTNGYFSEKQALDFLRKNRIPKCGDYVLFKKIPEKLKAIIKPGHAYYVFKIEAGRSKMTLDNDYAHWIDNDCLEICPKKEIKQRVKYH